MKTAYFDCFSGISGNMILGALLDTGVPEDQLRQGLEALPLGDRHFEVSRVTRQGISGTYLNVAEEHNETGRTLGSILRIIEDSTLPDEIKRQATRIFVRMAQAEAKVHHVDIDAAHLHEVGATDTIVDVVGSLIGFRYLGIQDVVCSPLNLGKGWAKCHHGPLPIPAPVTAELLKQVPVFSTDVEAELVTPTGAAIITSLASDFGDMPLMKVEAVGYGAGMWDLPMPNLLRVFLGESVEHGDGIDSHMVTLLETNIDDMNPQFYEYIMERLFQSGALDVFLTPVQMKKNRPGTMISVLAPREMANALGDILMEESTTLGVRISEQRRWCLPRLFRNVQTKFGEVRVKVAYRGDVIVKAVPEYEDCKRAAKDHRVPLNQVYAEAQNACQNISIVREDRNEPASGTNWTDPCPDD